MWLQKWFGVFFEDQKFPRILTSGVFELGNKHLDGKTDFSIISTIIGLTVLLTADTGWSFIFGVLKHPLKSRFFFCIAKAFCSLERFFFFLNSWFRSFLLLFSAEHFQFWAILGCLAGTICLRFTHTVLMVFRSGELWGLFQKLQFALLHDGF